MPHGLAPSVIRSFLQLVGHDVDEKTVGSWTELERVVAYDYAIRVRLNVEARAHNCNPPCELRACPSFVIAGDVHRGARCMWVELQLTPAVANG